MTMNRDEAAPQQQQQQGTTSSSPAAGSKATDTATATAIDDASNRPPPSLCLSNQLNPNNSWYNARLAAKYKTMSKEEKDKLWLMDLTKRLQAGRGSSSSGSSRKHIDGMTAVTAATEIGSLNTTIGPSGSTDQTWPAPAPVPPPPPPPKQPSKQNSSAPAAPAGLGGHGMDMASPRPSTSSFAATTQPGETGVSYNMPTEDLIVIGRASASGSTNVFSSSSLAGPTQSQHLGSDRATGVADLLSVQHSGPLLSAAMSAAMESQPGTSTSGVASQQLQDKLTVLQWWMATGEQLPAEELYRWSAVMQRVVALPSEVRTSLLELMLQASLVEPGLLVNTMAATRPGSALAQDYVTQDAPNQTFIPIHGWSSVSTALAGSQPMAAAAADPMEGMGVFSSGPNALYHNLKGPTSPGRNQRSSWTGTLPMSLPIHSMVIPHSQQQHVGAVGLAEPSLTRGPSLARMQSSPSLALAVQAGSTSSSSSLVTQPSTAELAYQACFRGAPVQLPSSAMRAPVTSTAGMPANNLDAAAVLNRMLAGNASMSSAVYPSASTLDSNEMSMSGHLSGSWALQQRQHHQQQMQLQQQQQQAAQLQQLQQLQAQHQQQQQLGRQQQQARSGSQRVKRNSWEEDVSAVRGWVGGMYIYDK